MTYLEEFEEQLRAKLLDGEPVEDIVALAVKTCRESWKNGLEACQNRGGKGKAPAKKEGAKHHYKSKK